MNNICELPFAHRGVHNIYPENSIPAFKKAIEMNVGIELDVHLTKSGEILVFHDYNLKRMTGINKKIEELKSKENKLYRLSNTNEYIPTLTEVLNLVNGKVPLLIELKTKLNYSKFAKKIKHIISSYKGEIYIQSFNPIIIRKLYKLNKNLTLGILSSFFEDEKKGLFKLIVKKLLLLSYSKANFIAYNIKNLPNKYTNKTNMPILSWVITNKTELEKAKKYSCNVITEYFE